MPRFLVSALFLLVAGASSPSGCRELAAHDPAAGLPQDAALDASGDRGGDNPLVQTDVQPTDLPVATPLVKGYGDVTDEYGEAIVDDGQGGAWITGAVDCSKTLVDFGKGSEACVGGTDLFVLHIDDMGTLRHSLVGGSLGDDRGWALTMDGSGGVWVAGRIAGEATIGRRKLEGYIKETDIFVMHITGVHVVDYLRAFGGKGFDAAEGAGICADGAGGVWVTAGVSEAVTVGQKTPEKFGGVDILLFHVSSEFVVGNVARWGGAGGDLSRACTPDRQGDIGDIIVVGCHAGNADFKPGFKQTKAGAFSARKQKSSGLTVTTLEATNARFTAVHASPTEVWAIGRFAGDVLVGGKTVSSVKGTGDIFVVGNGAQQVARFGTVGEDSAAGVVVRPNGIPWIVGTVAAGTIEVLLPNGKNTTLTAFAKGRKDVLIARLADDSVTYMRLGGPEDDVASGAAPATKGEIWITGYFRTTKGAPATFLNQALESTGSSTDVFVLRK